jgi:hypothetical protein
METYQVKLNIYSFLAGKPQHLDLNEVFNTNFYPAYSSGQFGLTSEDLNSVGLNAKGFAQP